MPNIVSMGHRSGRLTALGWCGTFYSAYGTLLPAKGKAPNPLQGIVVRFFEFCYLTLTGHGYACS